MTSDSCSSVTYFSHLLLQYREAPAATPYHVNIYIHICLLYSQSVANWLSDPSFCNYSRVKLLGDTCKLTLVSLLHAWNSQAVGLIYILKTGQVTCGQYPVSNHYWHFSNSSVLTSCSAATFLLAIISFQTAKQWSSFSNKHCFFQSAFNCLRVHMCACASCKLCSPCLFAQLVY